MTDPKAQRVFSLADCIPEPLTFRDSDAKVYDVKTRAMFGAKELASFNRLQRRYNAALATLLSDSQVETAQDQAAEEIDQLIDQLITTLIPDLPRERIAVIGINDKAAFLDFWRQEQAPTQPVTPVGETPGQLSIPA